MIELYDDRGESRGLYDERNSLNDLTGREWVFSTRSVIARSYPPSFQLALRNQHGGQKPPELCAELIRTFTKSGGRILDPFMGVGGTLLGATIEGRSAVGIEIEPRWVDIYREVCRLEGIAEQTVIVGDSRLALSELDGSFDFILTDVPFWNMDTAKRSNGTYKKHGQDAQDGKLRKALSTFNDGVPQTKSDWLKSMSETFLGCQSLLRDGGYLAIMIGEMYQAGRYHMLPAELAGCLEACGWVLKANLIWYDVGKQLHLYGYRYAFIPSLVHQNILILRKEQN